MSVVNNNIVIFLSPRKFIQYLLFDGLNVFWPILLHTLADTNTFIFQVNEFYCILLKNSL